MTCTSTWFKQYKNKSGELETIELPCGYCIACRIRRTAEWTKRILDESDGGKNSSFLTLTYNDENLPPFGSLVKSDFQKFIKRFRFNVKQDIKYYGCGEYGDKTHRPHYHIIMIGYQPELEELRFLRFNERGEKIFTTDILKKNWKFGDITTGIVVRESVQYVAGYVRKKIYARGNPYFPRIAPFSLSSNGIGKEYAEKNWKRIISEKGDTVNGKNLGIPRYYKKKYLTEEQKSMLQERSFENGITHLDYNDFSEYYLALKSDMDRRHSESMTKEELFNKREKL